MICELVYPVKLILDSILIHPECFTLQSLNVMCQWKLQIRSLKTSNGEKRGVLRLSSPNFCHWKLQASVTENFKWITENFKLLSLKTSNLFHWKLQASVIENFKWVSPIIINRGNRRDVNRRSSEIANSITFDANRRFWWDPSITLFANRFHPFCKSSFNLFASLVSSVLQIQFQPFCN